MAIAIVGLLPILIVFPFVQKYFVKEFPIGAVKGRKNGGEANENKEMETEKADFASLRRSVMNTKHCRNTIFHPWK